MQEPASFNRSKTQGNNRYQKNVRFDESMVDQSASFDKTNSNKPIEEIRTLQLDPQSRTSNNLAKVLLKNFWKINPEAGSIEITMSERLSNTKDFIVMEAYVFPYINVLWLGIIIMAIGTFIAILERLRANKTLSA